MKKIISLFLSLAILAAVLCGCSLDEIGKNISDAVNELAQFTGQQVKFKIKESTRIEPAAIPTDLEQSYYCYKSLSNEEKRIYRIILAAAENMTDGFIELGSCTQGYNADITAAYQAVANDHPELFWMPYSYLINNSGSRSNPEVMIAMSYSGKQNNCDWLIDKDDREQMENALWDAVDSIAENASGLSRYDAELYFHDYLCEEIDYVLGEPEDLVYTSYGALINGRAVCEGYSRAMQLLCQQLGIPCMLISGSSDGTGHLWNLIDPGDGWYHIDVTWDDNENGKPYKFYFNLTDSEITADRTISPDISTLSDKKLLEGSFNIGVDSCNNIKYNYYSYEGLIFDKDYKQTVPSLIYKSYYEGKEQTDFKFSTDKQLKSFEKGYKTYVGEIQDVLNRSGSNIVITDISIVKNTVIFYW